MCSGPNHTLSQASQIHLSAFFLCSDSWQLCLASRSQAILHSPDLLQQIWIFPPNGGSLGLSHPSCFLCSLFSDSSFINGAWRLNSVLFFFNKINDFHAILFHSWILPFFVVVVFWVFCCCCFGYCLFNEVLAEGTAPGVWNFPSAQPATPSASCGPVPGALQLEQCCLSPFPVPLLLRLLLHWPLWEQWILKFPCSSPDTPRFPVSLENILYLYFSAFHSLNI